MMTSNPRFSTSLAILLLFLRNGNSPRNVHRILLEIPKLRLTNNLEGENHPRLKVSPPSVSSTCRRLYANGLLGMFEAKPPRSPGKKMAAHYHLPTDDDVKALKLSRYLLSKIGYEFVASSYGRDVVTRIAPEYVMGALNIVLTSEEKRKLVTIVAGSPNALSRSLNDSISRAVERLGGNAGDRESVVNALFDYLNAARVMGIADAPIDVKWDGRCLLPASSPANHGR